MSLDVDTIRRACAGRPDFRDGLPLGHSPALPDWITNGWFAARFSAPAEMVSEQASLGKLASVIADWTRSVAQGGLAPVTEDLTLRVASEVAPNCKTCEGEGSHYCKQCEGDHDCAKCSGNGTHGKTVMGQSVFKDAGGVVTVVQESLARLLDGFRTVRAGAGELEPLFGIDGEGQLVVVVMPMRTSPGEVEAAAAAAKARAEVRR